MDLDKIKEVWRSQSNKEIYTSEQIFNMLKSKSINSVKWIFMISLSEVCIAIFIYLFSLMKPNTKLVNTLQTSNEYIPYVYKALNITVFIVSIVFIYYFFKSYRKIKVQSSVMDLTKQIINFRKRVNYFIYFNLAIFLIIFSVLIFIILSSSYSFEWISMNGLWVFISIASMFAISFGLLYLYYYLVYGVFLRRLKKNIKALKSVN